MENVQRNRTSEDARISLSALAAREWVAGLAAANLILLLALAAPPTAGTPPDAAVTNRDYAPWVFGAVQVLLRHLPPVWGGIALPAVGLLLLAALPYLARRGWDRYGRRLVGLAYVGVALLTLYFLIRG